VHLLTSPLTWGLLLALLLLAVRRRLPRFVVAIALALECLLLVAISPLGANALVDLLESRVPPPAACEAAAPGAIVVLSAGLDRDPHDASDFTALNADSIGRALAGIIAWRRHPGASLVFAGGGPFATSESAVLQNFAEQLGVPAAAIRREGDSQTTWENAERLHALQPPLPAQIWLVSSAIHLPRALIAFRAAGFAPCPYASDRRYVPPGGIGYYLPQSSALRKSELALHELAGAIDYRWRAGAPVR
jgi:uncharacterized SAM-binding protein YcdF (DUF218 family)